MANYTLPNGSVETFAGMAQYAHEMSGYLWGNLVLVGVFLILLVWNIQEDGFKKRAVFSFFMTAVLGLFLMYINIVSGFVLGIFVTGSVLTILWVGFTGIN